MAAGTGERMNSDIPKQFMEINGLPIIIHTYKLFKEIENLNIYIVLPPEKFTIKILLTNIFKITKSKKVQVINT